MPLVVSLAVSYIACRALFQAVKGSPGAAHPLMHSSSKARAYDSSSRPPTTHINLKKCILRSIARGCGQACCASDREY